MTPADAAGQPGRYERKFFITELEEAHVRSVVRHHPLLFIEADPPRYVNNLVGWKESYSFPAFEFGSGLAAPALRRLIRGSPLPPEIKDHLANHRLALINRYRREYYVSQDGRFRVTIDSELTYFRAMPLASALVARGVDHGVVIVELKYDQPHERGADRVASLFPFRVTRSSKYVRGVEWFGAYAS
jgi:hypothetical protein